MEIKNEKGEVVRTNRISLLLAKMKQRGLFNDIIRYRYTDYDINESLQMIEILGKSRTQKFVIDDENRFTYTNLIKWVHGDASMQCLDADSKEVRKGDLKRGIYIAGNTGTGKSWALEIILEYSRLMGFQITFDDKLNQLVWANVSADDVCARFTNTGNIDGYKKTNIIGIQDLGAEPTECCFMGNKLEVLRTLIESRGDRTDAMTLFTSNFPMSHKTLIDRYGDRVASRLVEMCNYMEIKGKDRRKL